MEIPVRTDFVPVFCYLAHAVDVVVRPAPAEEESCADIKFVQNIEYLIDVRSILIDIEHQRNAASSLFCRVIWLVMFTRNLHGVAVGKANNAGNGNYCAQNSIDYEWRKFVFQNKFTPKQKYY